MVISSSKSPIQACQHKLKAETPDFDKYRPYFGWVNADTIRDTFKNTTQWGASVSTFPMRKHLKSRNPALNIPRRHEAVATDTVYSDTPAVDSGVKQAQLFVGKESLVSDIYPMRSGKPIHPSVGISLAESKPLLHGHPHPASRTLSMSPPGMGLLHTPRITSKSTSSLAILFSTSPDAVMLLQQTPSSLTLLLLMMVQPWPNSSVATILLSVMHMASNQPNNSSTPSLITSENGEPWMPSSVMEANMKSPSKSLISSVPYSSTIIRLNLIINIKIRQKIALDLPSVTPTLS